MNLSRQRAHSNQQGMIIAYSGDDISARYRKIEMKVSLHLKLESSRIKWNATC